jgi:Family of unknown function (DUF6510)
MTGNVSDLLLDGNAATLILQEIFAPDITLATIRCERCAAVSRVGSLQVHAAPMGAVLNCRSCDCILMRAVQTPYGRWLEMTGARCLKFP